MAVFGTRNKDAMHFENNVLNTLRISAIYQNELKI